MKSLSRLNKHTNDSKALFLRIPLSPQFYINIKAIYFIIELIW